METTIEGAPSLKMRCVEKRPRRRKARDVAREVPEGVADRLAELLPADALEEALDGLSPEEITGPAGC